MTTLVAPHHDHGPEGPGWLALLRPWTLPANAAAVDERIATACPLSLPWGAVQPKPVDRDTATTEAGSEGRRTKGRETDE